jgi:hypothetical protein
MRASLRVSSIGVLIAALAGASAPSGASADATAVMARKSKGEPAIVRPPHHPKRAKKHKKPGVPAARAPARPRMTQG